MSDEEIRQLAQEILLEVCREDDKVVDGTEFRAFKNRQGRVVFELSLNEAEFGFAKMSYSPQPYIESLIRFHEEILDLSWEEGIDASDLEAAEFYFELEVLETASLLVRTLKLEFENFVAQRGPSARQTYLKGSRDHFPLSALMLESLPDTCGELDNQRKRALDGFRNEIANKRVGPCVLFSLVYDLEKKRSNEAKRCFKSNKNHSKPLEVVARAFPDRPKDLLEDIRGLDSRDDSHDSTAESLALRSTAEIVGVPGRVRSKRALQAYLQKSRKIRNRMSKDEILATIDSGNSFEPFAEYQESLPIGRHLID